MAVSCPYCGKPAKLVTGNVIYPYRKDLFDRFFWRCAPCNAYVGTHRNSQDKAPLGRLADAELRTAKVLAHSAFDPLWRTGEMSRASAYKWLSEALGISRANCHIGMFDVDQCKAVVAAVKARSPICTAN